MHLSGIGHQEPPAGRAIGRGGAPASDGIEIDLDVGCAAAADDDRSVLGVGAHGIAGAENDRRCHRRHDAKEEPQASQPPVMVFIDHQFRRFTGARGVYRRRHAKPPVQQQ